MLSRWLFTTAIALSILAGSSFSAPAPEENNVGASENTINLLKDGLPTYDKLKDKDGLLKVAYDAIEKLIKDEKNSARNLKTKRTNSKVCDLTKVKVRREW